MTLKQALRRMKPGQQITFKDGPCIKEKTGTFRKIMEKRPDHIPQKWLVNEYRDEPYKVYEIK